MHGVELRPFVNRLRPEERRIRRKIRTVFRLEEQLEVAMTQVTVGEVHSAFCVLRRMGVASMN